MLFRFGIEIVLIFDMVWFFLMFVVEIKTIDKSQINIEIYTLITIRIIENY